MSDDKVSTPVTPAAPANGARRRWIGIVVAAFVVLGAAYGAYWALALRYTQSTDDAYVNGNVVQITPQIAGTVVSIAADDTQFVKEGDTLVQLDTRQEQAQLTAAQAQRDELDHGLLKRSVSCARRMHRVSRVPPRWPALRAPC